MSVKNKSKTGTRVCLVIPSLQAGGMERVMSELAGYFSAKSETEVHLILYGITREIFYRVPESVIIHRPQFTFNNRWRFYYSLRTIFFLRKSIKRIDPGTILSFGEYWNNFVLLSIYGLRYPAFVSDRSQPDKSLGWVHNKLRKCLYPGARGLIFQTEKAKEIYLTNNRHRNIAVIGNPIRKFNTPNIPVTREKSILMVGRLIKTKHQDKLIEIFANVAPADWNLVIVGYDHLKQNNLERLKGLTRDLEVEQRVLFTGKQDNVEEIYLKSSIFAFTSSSEGFPNVIGEAMAAGLPVIAFDCVAGPSEMIIDGHNGFLIPLFDDTQFQTKLALLISDENLRKEFGRNATESINSFSGEKISEAFYKFIMN